MHIHNKLYNTDKGVRSVSNYMQDLHNTCDELVTAEQPVQETVTIYTLLQGLGLSYATFNVRIT